MKILYWNICEGCEPEARFEALLSCLANESADIVGLSELNGWQEEGLARMQITADRLGLPHYVFCESESGYHLGLFSRYPIFYSRLLLKPFKTGCILAKISTSISEVMIVLTHLHSDFEEKRMQEVTLILEAIPTDIPAILMGDLNTLSLSDLYDETNLISTFQNFGISKFGKGFLDRRVIPEIIRHGLIDTLRVYSRDFEYSVPTTANEDPMHCMPLRLDYIFVTKDLVDQMIDAQIICSECVENVSDHFPCRAEFKLRI